MASQGPPHWTFAARAAYFGDRMCPFCDHRNPADAKFCNECASPLHLKPCNQCNRVNEQAATRCYQCGTAFPSLPRTPDARQTSPSVELASGRATSSDAADTATMTHAPFAAPVPRAYRNLRTPGLLVASVATILIAGAYAMHYIDAHAPDATKGSSKVASAAKSDAPSASPTVAAAPERGPMGAETAAAVAAPTPAVESDAQTRVSVRQDPAPIPAAKRAGAPQHPARERGTAMSAARRKAHPPVAPTARAPVAEIKKAGPERWQAMYTSLARCSGDVSARIVCDERVRRQFCEGHWNNAPACANGLLADRGQ
jgi:hypothetical protein